MKGFTGILRPNGIFVSCDYGNHCTIAIDIPQEEEISCIYFSSSIKSMGNDNNSVIYFCEEVTKNQLLWIMENIDGLDDKQYEIWIDYIKKRSLINE